MNEQLLAIAVSNVALAVVLALVAWAVQARAKRPWLAHVLWLLVLVKLVTPPIASAPLITIPAPLPDAAALLSEAPSNASAPMLAASAAARPAPTDVAPPSDLTLAGLAPRVSRAILWLWLIGSAIVLAVSLVRITRFARTVRTASRPADPDLAHLAGSLAKRLGLRRVPEIRLVHASITPLVWWIGGRPTVVLPQSMVTALEPSALRLVVAHELAHVRRGDHLVRWLEWTASVLFWWCPLLWIARRGLRRNEELCCDAFVVERLSVSPNTYANSILDAVELLAGPALRPPVVASQMTSGGSLEDRLTMIVSNRVFLSPSLRTRVAGFLVAAVVLPFGIAHAQAPDYEAVGERLMDAIDSGELSQSQARAMYGALAAQHFDESFAARRAEAGDAPDRRDRDEMDLTERLDNELTREMYNAIEEREISRDDANRRMAELRNRMVDAARKGDTVAAYRDQLELARQLEQGECRRPALGRDRAAEPARAGARHPPGVRGGLDRGRPSHGSGAPPDRAARHVQPREDHGTGARGALPRAPGAGPLQRVPARARRQRARGRDRTRVPGSPEGRRADPDRGDDAPARRGVPPRHGQPAASAPGGSRRGTRRCSRASASRSNVRAKTRPLAIRSICAISASSRARSSPWTDATADRGERSRVATRSAGPRDPASRGPASSAVQQHALADGQRPGARDRAVHAGVAVVRACADLHHDGVRGAAVRVQVDHRAAQVAHRDGDRGSVIGLPEREDAAHPPVLLERRGAARTHENVGPEPANVRARPREPSNLVDRRRGNHRDAGLVEDAVAELHHLDRSAVSASDLRGEGVAEDLEILTLRRADAGREPVAVPGLPQRREGDEVGEPPRAEPRVRTALADTPKREPAIALHAVPSQGSPRRGSRPAWT